jgi:hypothetical protein
MVPNTLAGVRSAAHHLYRTTSSSGIPYSNSRQPSAVVRRSDALAQIAGENMAAHCAEPDEVLKWRRDVRVGAAVDAWQPAPPARLG